MKTIFPCKNCVVLPNCSQTCNEARKYLDKVEMYADRTNKCRLCGNRLNITGSIPRYKCVLCGLEIGEVFSYHSDKSQRIKNLLHEYKDRLSKRTGQKWKVLLIYRTPPTFNGVIRSGGGHWRAVLVNNKNEKRRAFYRTDLDKARWTKA